MHDPVRTVSGHISQPALRRLQLRLRPLLRAPGRIDTPGQGQGGGDVGCDSAVQGQPAQVRDRWFAERKHLGTPLSQSELEHGVRMGLLGSVLVGGDDGSD